MTTVFDTSGNIMQEVTDISNYTIPGTISIPTFLRFLAKAEEQVTLDDPGFQLAQCTEAVALYICHQIYRKTGKSGVTSERLGSYSLSRGKGVQLTPWLDDYYDLIERVRAPVISLSTLDTNGVRRDDATMNLLRPDQAWVVESDEQSNPPTGGIGDLMGYR